MPRFPLFPRRMPLAAWPLVTAQAKIVRSLAVIAVIALLAAPTEAAASVDALRSSLAAAIRDKDPSAVRDAVDELVRLDTEAAVDMLIEVGLLCDSPRMEEIVRDTMRGMKKKGAAIARAIHHCNEHKDPRVRDQLVHVLAYRRNTDAYKAVLTRIFDPVDSVALSACDALALKGHVGSVKHLIRALKLREDEGKKNSQVANAIRRTLTDLTTYRFDSSADWTIFWDAHGPGFKKPTKEEVRKREAEELEEERRGTGVVVKKKRRVPQFFGQEVPSQRVVFVLDTSMSMRDKDPIPTDVKVSGPRMRIRRVQQELKRIISAMPSDTEFTVIAFSNKVRTLSGTQLLPANNANKQKARKFVEKFRADGETYTDEALEAAFKVRDARTIILLSDGAPVRNTVVMDVPKILRWVDRANRFRHIQINTVGFRGARAQTGDFLSELAYRNNGQYLELP